MKPVNAIVAVLILLLAAPAAARERVKLSTGRTLVGDIESQDDKEVVLRTDAGLLHLPRAQIVSIETIEEVEEPKAATPESKDADPAPSDAPATGKGVEKPKGASKDEGDAPAKPEAGEGDTPKAPPKGEGAVEEPDEAWKAKVLADLGDRIPKKRAAAAQAIVDAWPGSASVLDAALAYPDKTVRLEAVRLLGLEALGDTQARIRKALSDRYGPVRQMAARAVRHRGFEMEKDLLPLVRNDSEPRVVIEALRALEDVGTWRCYQTVYRRWNNESEKELKRRYRRNLKRFLDVDHGDDAAAWLKAVNDAVEKARVEQK